MAKVSNYFSFLVFLGAWLFFGQAQALDIKWMGTTCVTISDGEHSLMFDPFFTRPSMWKVMTFQKLPTDTKIVDEWLKKTNSQSLDAIFVSHSHYDHAQDLPYVAIKTKAKVYGSKSTKNIALGSKVPEEQIQVIRYGETVGVGKFRIKVIAGEHPPHFAGLTVLDGPIKKSLKTPARVTAYKMGLNYAFHIIHPQGKILYHPGATPIEDPQSYQADLLMLGIANRKSSKELIEKVIKPVNPRLLVPIHHDNFFKPLSEKPQNMFSLNADEFFKAVNFEGAKFKLLRPGFGEPIPL